MSSWKRHDYTGVWCTRPGKTARAIQYGDTPSGQRITMRIHLQTTIALVVTTSLAAAGPVDVTDVTESAGIRFTHNNGAFGEKYLPETFGSGALWLDVDADGWQDLLFVNGTHWPGQSPSRPDGAHATLYRNDGDGTFSDITANSGLGVPLYGLGGTAADFDNDGSVDVYVTALGANRLFKGQGNGRFVDVTTEAGVGDPGFSTSALWVDYDEDGYLDLFVGNYVEWSIETDLFCPFVDDAKAYCTPESYQGQSPTLYRNRGDGTFEDVTSAAGLRTPSAKALGVTMLDFDSDGWMDLFVANDLQPDLLFRNRGDGTFEDIGVLAGVAFSDSGVARAGMGVDAIDYDRSGRPDLLIGHFSSEMMALYHNEGSGLFIDEGPRSAIGRASLLSLTFGCFFFDVDLDGWPDIFAVNGHVNDLVERVQNRVTYAQRAQLFLNDTQGGFQEVAAVDGTALASPLVGRGAAYADMDNDGDLDVVVTANGGPARLLRNDGGNANHLLRVRLVGTASNRDGIGARIEITADGVDRWQLVKTGSSYLSQSELPVTFGLGATTTVSALRVTWPNGETDDVGAVNADQLITVTEGAGRSDASPIGRGR